MVDEHQFSQLLFLLDKLKFELKKATLWSEQKPTAAALRSTQPFCCDTLALEQWLQFIFIERLSVLVANKLPLPRNIAVSPIAEDAFKCTSQLKVIDVVADIDELLSGQLVPRPWQSKTNTIEKNFIS